MTASRPPAPRAAYRIRTERLLIRCWDPADAPLLNASIAGSLDHLRRWMPWAYDDPETDEAKAERLRGFRSSFDQGKAFFYGIFDPDETRVIGSIGMHDRVGEHAREIGYWIHQELLGRGYATEATAALTRVAFEALGLRRVEIHCDPRNERSAAVPRRLGYLHEATLRRRTVDHEGVMRDSMIWTMLPEELRASPAARYAVDVRDALGRPLW